MTVQELKKEINYWEGKIAIYEEEVQNINLSQKRYEMLKEHIKSMKNHERMLKNLYKEQTS